ncbi:hypothetical protein Tco_1519464 [Tanacetum coccineum]
MSSPPILPPLVSTIVLKIMLLPGFVELQMVGSFKAFFLHVHHSFVFSTFIVYAAIRANGMVAKVLAISDVAPRHLSPTLRHHTIFTRHYLARQERKEQKDNPFSNVTV